MSGIAGLRAGIGFVQRKGIQNIFNHEMSLINYLYKKLSGMKGIKLYTSEPKFPYFVPVLSFNVGDVSSEVIASKLNDRGISVRSGLHCAPSAHDYIGTLEQGAVRVCPSAFSNMNEINTLVLSLLRII